MSFSRVNPPGWAVGDQLTSAQMNQLDIDHSLSLKGGNTTGTLGDTLFAQIQVSTSGSIILNVAGGILAATGDSVHVSAVGGIQPSIAGGILAHILGGIQADVAGGIQSTIAGGIKTTVAAGFQLGGGSSDWPTFSTTRGKTYSFGPKPSDPGAIGGTLPISWDFGSFPTILTGHAKTTQINLWLDNPHNGATLSAITLFFAVGQSHTGVPGVMPSMTVQRTPVAFQSGSAPAGSQALSTTASQSFAAPGSGAAWFSSNQVQFLSYTCNQNNVIDNINYTYYIGLVDENGANSLSGNQYLGFQAVYTGITNMVFPF